MPFAEEPPPPDPPPLRGEEVPSPPKPGGVQGMVKDPSFIVWSVVLAGVLLAAAVLFMLFDRWRKRPTGATARDEVTTFGSFRQMYENGELTEAEYEKIRAKMAAKMKEKMGILPPAAPPPGPPPVAPPPVE